MKFRYYITNLIAGKIVGTDDEATARNYAMSEDFFVVDTENGTWLLSDGVDDSIEEAPKVTDEEDEMKHPDEEE